MSLDLATIIGILSALAAITAAIFAYPAWKQWRTQQLLEKNFGAELYDRETIERSTRYYIRPNCSSIDPAREAEIRQVVVTKKSLFEKIDEYLSVEPHSRHLLLLADSGMGKSSFVLNYYAYNQNRAKRNRHRLTVIPLGIPNANEVISKIDNKRDTVIFLDAFDEDTQAIKDHRDRLFELMEACREFKRVLITCRTQFFPSDKEIPKETGIARIGPRKLGESGVYEFWKLYLAPLTDEQVDTYIRKRYSIFQRNKRDKARELVTRIPLLSVRSMLFAYIPDLLDSNTQIEYSFQLYEIMVEKWLERESGWVKPDALRAFSERLAVDLYINREKRGAERIAGSELLPLSKEWKINLQDWQLRGRSLLNRDATGNYKFAHRSIMEYLFVRKLISGDDICRKWNRTDQMNVFLWEMLTKGGNRLKLTQHELARYPLQLRSTPSERLSEDDVGIMLRKYGFFDSRRHKLGQGLVHLYQVYRKAGAEVVIDHATGLMWLNDPKLDSRVPTSSDAEEFIRFINIERLAGYNDWRLPTLEELMSLMEPTAERTAYIDPIIHTDNFVWTADKYTDGCAWLVYFVAFGTCDAFTGYVRSVSDYAEEELIDEYGVLAVR